MRTGSVNPTGRTNTGTLLTPDQINSQAIRGIVGILLIVALTMFTGWLVRGTAEAAGGPAGAPDLAVATTTSTTAAAPTTTVVKSTTTTVVKPTTTSTTVVKSTTTTTEIVVKPTTTTVVKPTPTTTVSTTTTADVKPTTTTTTVVKPTTTTTVPATTTTVISKAEAVFLSKFAADPVGDPGSWEARVKIEVRTDTGAKAAHATVQVIWGGRQSGRISVSADQNGKVGVTIGPFSDGAVKIGVQDIELGGLRYRPELNTAAATIAVSAPS